MVPLSLIALLHHSFCSGLVLWLYSPPAFLKLMAPLVLQQCDPPLYHVDMAAVETNIVCFTLRDTWNRPTEFCKYGAEVYNGMTQILGEGMRVLMTPHPGGASGPCGIWASPMMTPGSPSRSSTSWLSSMRSRE